MSKSFGQTLFKELYNCDTWCMRSVHNKLNRILDHGFIADRACIWDPRLDGHEMAIVARTYADDDEIANPPLGLKCVRLDSEVMGDVTAGTPIAVVVEAPTTAAEDFLGAMTDIPADMIAYAISRHMISNGYCVTLQAQHGLNIPNVKITKEGF